MNIPTEVEAFKAVVLAYTAAVECSKVCIRMSHAVCWGACDQRDLVRAAGHFAEAAERLNAVVQMHEECREALKSRKGVKADEKQTEAAF